MSAQVIKLRPAKLECSNCGASATAACDCHAPYVPAGERAARAVAANPEKSNRALATELGVAEGTVRSARKNPGAQHYAPEKRVGKDGKKYPAKPKATTRRPFVPLPSDPIQEDCGGCNTEEERWQHSLGVVAGDAVSIRAFWTRQFGDWRKFEVPSSLVTLAKQAAEAWTELAEELAKQ